MKKLNLNLEVKAKLTKEQMKKINGGYWACYCANDVNNPVVVCPPYYDSDGEQDLAHCRAIAETLCDQTGSTVYSCNR